MITIITSTAKFETTVDQPRRIGYRNTAEKISVYQPLAESLKVTERDDCYDTSEMADPFRIIYGLLLFMYVLKVKCRLCLLPSQVLFREHPVRSYILPESTFCILCQQNTEC